MKGQTPARTSASAHDTREPGLSAPGSTDAEEHADGEQAKHGAIGHLSSDEELQQAVCNALIETRELDTSDVAVAAANAKITLSGSVATAGDRVLAERIALGQAGVHGVHTEELRVRQA